MTSILDEIHLLRKNNPLVIDYKNTNRYRVVVNENDGSKTAYYFTSPIYNAKTGKAVNLKFNQKDNYAYATGSNADIFISENIRLENSEGYALISLNNKPTAITDNEIICNNKKIYPTINGIGIESICQTNDVFSFSLEISTPNLHIRANDKCFALMLEKFRPFIVISCIGASDANGNVISPAKIFYQKITDNRYMIDVTPCSPLAKSILLEINLYEPKLFQDTTVESKNPTINNVFGSISFLGTTKEFGEQWLYTRPDYSKLLEMNNKEILSATLHLPKLNENEMEITASEVSARFCSFGSTWNNKVEKKALVSNSIDTSHYISLDLTSLFSDGNNIFSKTEGVIIKSKNKGVGFSVVATADSYLFPQILEINFK
jgi:hypothetical protein